MNASRRMASPGRERPRAPRGLRPPPPPHLFPGPEKRRVGKCALRIERERDRGGETQGEMGNGEIGGGSGVFDLGGVKKKGRGDARRRFASDRFKKKGGRGG